MAKQQWIGPFYATRVPSIEVHDIDDSRIFTPPFRCESYRILDY
jgi:hypothetical protein